MGDLFKLAAAWPKVVTLRHAGFRIGLDQVRASGKWKCIIWGDSGYGWYKRCDGMGANLAEAIIAAFSAHLDLVVAEEKTAQGAGN